MQLRAQRDLSVFEINRLCFCWRTECRKCLSREREEEEGRDTERVRETERGSKSKPKYCLWSAHGLLILTGSSLRMDVSTALKEFLLKGYSRHSASTKTQQKHLYSTILQACTEALKGKLSLTSLPVQNASRQLLSLISLTDKHWSWGRRARWVEQRPAKAASKSLWKSRRVKPNSKMRCHIKKDQKVQTWMFKLSSIQSQC